MGKHATVKYKSLRTNLVHLPLSLYASLTQQQSQPQSIVLHLEPLSPTSSRAVSAYLGWSGAASTSSLSRGLGAGETVEIDPEAAMALGWAEGMTVEIKLINNPIRARSATVTPVSEDDWEILEQHAAFLEDNLLTQLRAVTKGQTYNVWVHRTKIQIRVDETNPKTSEKSTVLLHTGTEVHVAPRLRKANGNDTTTLSSQALNGDTIEHAKTKSAKIRLIPGRVAAQWAQPNAMSDQTLYCSDQTLRMIQRKLGDESQSTTYVRAEMINIGKEADGTGSTEDKKEEESKDDGLECDLAVWDEVPDGCGVIAGISKKDWSEWARIRLYKCSPPRGRLKKTDTKDASSPLLDTPSDATSLLAVFDPVKNEAVDYFRRAIYETPRPILITGAKGSGKTAVVKAIAATLEMDRSILCEPLYQDVARINVEGRLKETKEHIEGWMDDARERRPALLILDGLDNLLGPEHELTPSTSPTILAELFCRLFTPSNLRGVMVIATASDSSALHPLLNTKHIFGETIKIAPLSKEGRRDVLSNFVQSKAPYGDNSDSLDYVTLASKTEGYSISDLGDLVNNTEQEAMIRSNKEDLVDYRLTMADFDVAQTTFTPISLRGVTLQKSSVRWSDIGGLHEPRRLLRETLEWPTKYAQIFASCPLRLRSGILLYGYSGCGKTLLASAVARECGLNFISVKGPEILNKYIGASEKSVRDLFARATSAKPCILFFDEFDSIAPKRGHDSTGVTDRVVNQMLTEMDGAQGLDGVYVLAATSRPDLIDSALLRPGRLDKAILCDMPNEQERLEILNAIADSLDLSPDVDLADLAAKTTNMSGADLQALVYNAHLDVVHSTIRDKPSQLNGSSEKTSEEQKRTFRQIAPKLLDSQVVSVADRAEMELKLENILANANRSIKTAPVLSADLPEPIIEQHHLERSLSTTRPSVSAADRRRLSQIYAEFSNDRGLTDVNEEMGRDTGTRSTLM